MSNNKIRSEDIVSELIEEIINKPKRMFSSELDKVYYNSTIASRLIDAVNQGEISELDCFKILTIYFYHKSDEAETELTIKKGLEYKL